MKKLVILTGAGMSAESGIKTFREAGGLWEEHDVMEVASFDGWQANPELVNRFYNERRKQLFEVEPNEGHYKLAEMEKDFDIEIVTQNIDDLHERAGSSNVLHLHGELKKVESTVDPSLVYTLDHWEVKIGDKCEKGSQLRPHVVWFGESVPKMVDAMQIFQKADICAVIGTSLLVYPAAGLLNYLPVDCPIFLVDPNPSNISASERVESIEKGASEGVKILHEKLLNL